MADAPFTFIGGDDDFLVAERGKRWFAARAEGLADDLSREVIDGRAGNMAEAEETVRRFAGAVQTLSLFGERKVVWLRDVNFLGDTPTGRAEGTKEALETLRSVLEAIDPESVDALITACPVDKRRSFFKWCQQTGECETVSAGKDIEATLRPLLDEACRELGVSMTDAGRAALIGKLGGNSRLAVEETRKLATYLGPDGGRIDADTVAELVPNFGGADFFEATDAFFTLRLDATLEALQRHFFTESEARPLLASLQNRTRLTIQLRALMDAGALKAGSRGIDRSALAEAERRYGHAFGEGGDKDKINVFAQNPWYLGRLAQSARRIPLRRLIDFQLQFAEAFEKIIERPDDQREVMREAAVACLS